MPEGLVHSDRLFTWLREERERWKKPGGRNGYSTNYRAGAIRALDDLEARVLEHLGVRV